MTDSTTIHQYLRAALAKGAFEPDNLHRMREEGIAGAAEAEAVLDAIADVLERPRGEATDELLTDLTPFFQSFTTQEAADVFRERGAPLLRRVFERLREPRAPGAESDADELLYLLKLFAMYGDAEGLAAVPDLIRRPEFRDHYLWTVVFGQLIQAPPEIGARVAQALREPLPEGFARAAYLDLVNELCRRGAMDRHPFDTDEGKAQLAEYLEAGEGENASFAVSAAMALAFVSPPERDALLDAARAHPEMMVQLETAWAEGHLGRETGIDFLARQAEKIAYGRVAHEYLKMLGREDRVPAICHDENYQATVAMASWLAHPNEFGRPPDAIELIDSREMFWPPTGDQRRLWAFRYKYEGEDVEEPVVDYGMVGSTTFSVFEGYGDNPTPEDIYAAHCAWEMGEQPYLEKGRELLKDVFGAQ
jgi:hypothetical protein